MLQSTVSRCANQNFRIAYSSEALMRDLARVHQFFCEFQTSRARNAIFPYLSEVFGLVELWTVDRREVSRARRALNLLGIKDPAEIEPFAAVIIATAHPTKLDKRVISKWSRVLRYAARVKSRSEALQDFIGRKGGLNECAALYAHRLGRRAD